MDRRRTAESTQTKVSLTLNGGSPGGEEISLWCSYQGGGADVAIAEGAQMMITETSFF